MPRNIQSLLYAKLLIKYIQALSLRYLQLLEKNLIFLTFWERGIREWKRKRNPRQRDLTETTAELYGLVGHVWEIQNHVPWYLNQPIRNVILLKSAIIVTTVGNRTGDRERELDYMCIYSLLTDRGSLSAKNRKVCFPSLMLRVFDGKSAIGIWNLSALCGSESGRRKNVAGKRKTRQRHRF